MYRRTFLKRVASASTLLGFPTIIPSSVLGRNGLIPPSEKVVFGSIGLGLQGVGNTSLLIRHPRVQLVALCDVSRRSPYHGYEHDQLKGLEPAAEQLGGKYDLYEDFRELLARDDIDAITTATPDHWHAYIGIAAVRAGKDVYAEKPLTRTIAEGIRLRDEVSRHGRIWQTGSWQRSRGEFQRAAEMVANGFIGKVSEVHIGVPPNEAIEPLASQPVPEGFNWDRWLGPAPYAPYHPYRTFTTWRFVSDYSAGKIADWGAHHIDAAHWALGYNLSGPVEVVVDEVAWPTDGFFDQPTLFSLTYTYPNGERIKVSDQYRKGIEFIGEDDRRIFVTRGHIESTPASLLREPIPLDGKRVYAFDGDHTGDFVDAIYNRSRTAADIEIAHRTNTACLLGEIAYRTGRKIRWDVQSESIIEDEEAARLTRRAHRAPWSVV